MNEEFKLRFKKVLPYLEQNNLGGILISAEPWEAEHLRYITNYRLLGTSAYALVSRRGELTLFISVLTDLPRAEKESWANRVILLTGTLDELVAEVKRLKILGEYQKLGVVSLDSAPAKALTRIKSSFPKVEFVSSARALAKMRVIKTEREIESIRRSAQIADIGFETFLKYTRPGIKQYELIAEVEYRVRHEGAEDNFMLISSGGIEVRGMSPARNLELKSGDMVLTEITPAYNGYFTQVCRPVVLGDISPERRKSFDIFFRAAEAGIKAARPGVPVSEVAKAENQVFRDEGYGEYVTDKWTRSRGHGQGLHLSEEPLIWEDNDQILQEGMLLIIHPNTYLPLAGYMVFGDPTLITAEGPQILSKTPRRIFGI